MQLSFRTPRPFSKLSEASTCCETKWTAIIAYMCAYSSIINEELPRSLALQSRTALACLVGVEAWRRWSKGSGPAQSESQNPALSWLLRSPLCFGRPMASLESHAWAHIEVIATCSSSYGRHSEEKKLSSFEPR